MRGDHYYGSRGRGRSKDRRRGRRDIGRRDIGRRGGLDGL